MKLYLSIIGLCGALSLSAQQIVPLSYRQYMEKVVEGNLEYAAERLNVNVSEAEVTAAMIRTCPILILLMRITASGWVREWKSS